MTRADAGRDAPRKGFPEKRNAIVRAARQVFGRIGYQGASIDVIAAEAGVSTRTIYNHFENKERLFVTVLLDSSEQVATAHEALIERHLGGATSTAEVEGGLVALAKDWVRPGPEFAEHCSMVTRLATEGESVPEDLHGSWQQAGPRRVQGALAAHLTRLAGRGLLDVPDPARAAQHFVALITPAGAHGKAGTDPLPEAEAEAVAVTGVRAFLYGCLPRG
ncbi:TetR/AcrR family transcriptional regulator [Streptomyces sp. LE64]|uniref:TetR/AcrR family transcriptional regulator n=1 Tax=Streptomyces sp. LE64 TaxID=3448653 RepID=UPI0040435F3A